VEEGALRGLPGMRILRTGMGPARARTAAARALAVDAHAVVIAGVCAAIDPSLRTGDVVCATELRRNGAAPVEVPGSAALADEVRRRGLRVHVGPVRSADRLTGPADRHGLDELAVDMESAWLAEGAGGRPLAVLRVVADVADRRLFDPRLLLEGSRALLSLRRTGPALTAWAAVAARESQPSAQPEDLVAT
jgi:4-hydroxy-3-methylbut-2-enyl diphosphate reductase